VSISLFQSRRVMLQQVAHTVHRHALSITAATLSKRMRRVNDCQIIALCCQHGGQIALALRVSHARQILRECVLRVFAA
jgi:predicted nucleic acid-binding protein